MLSEEQSAHNTGREGLSIAANGAQRRAERVGHRALFDRSGTSSVEYGAIRERCEALKDVEHGAIRDQHQSFDVNHGAIRV
jgi:hypothetical protein